MPRANTTAVYIHRQKCFDHCLASVANRIPQEYGSHRLASVSIGFLMSNLLNPSILLMYQDHAYYYIY